MKIEIVNPSHIEKIEEYSLHFEQSGFPGSGYGFPCDAQGAVETGSMGPKAVESYRMCQTGHLKGEFEAPVVQNLSREYRHPSVGKCQCGTQVTLDGFTNTCSGCGADYNRDGSRLAPREQWGEETGESVADILQIP
jgi:hypothetical protein